MKTKPNILDWNRLNLASSLNVFRVHTTGLEIVQLEPFCRHWERDKKTIRLIRPTHISTKHLLSVLIKRLLNSKLLSGISDSNTQHQAKFLTFILHLLVQSLITICQDYFRCLYGTFLWASQEGKVVNWQNCFFLVGQMKESHIGAFLFLCWAAKSF
jgi:hypothetical protein